MLVAGDQYPEGLSADTIQVLRPADAPLPLYQFTNIVHKMGTTAWLIGDTAVAITTTTQFVGEPALDGLVRVTARRVDNELMALEIAAIASNSEGVPFAIEGTVEQVTDQSWVVDDQSIIVPQAPSLGANQGDTVEVSAVSAPDGTLVAREAHIVDATREALVDGYVTAVDGLRQDNQTWKLVVFNDGRAETHTIKVTPETYVAEDRTLIEPDVEALVQGQKSGPASVNAALVRLEPTTPAVAAGTLTQMNSDGMWRVGNQTVWFASDELKKQALAASGASQDGGGATAPTAGATSAQPIAVAGAQLSSGVLVAKEVLTGDAAKTSLVASATSEAAAGWRGPNYIVPQIQLANKPTVLFDARGAGHAVFESQGKIFYAYQGPGEAWGAPRKIGTGVTPSAVLDARGQVNVAYTSEFLGNWDILSVRLTDRGWSLPTVVAPTSGRSADPVIAVDATGRVCVAWMDLTSGEYAIQMGVFDGKFWTSYPVPNARGQSPALAVLPDGALFLTWQDRIPLGTDAWGNYDIFASERDDQLWSLPVNVSNNRQFRPGSDALGSRVVGTPDSLAHLAWIDDTTQLRYDFGRGQYWPVPVNVGAPRPKAEGLSIQVAPDGLLYLAWNEGAAIRVLASPPRTQNWPAAETVGTASAPANGRVSGVSLTAGRGGVAVAWVQDNVSGGMGVYESRHNMAPTMLKSYLPMLTQRGP